MADMPQPCFIAIDWGTSSFRLWAMSRNGEVVSTTRNDNGMSRLKPDDYASVMASALSELGIAEGLPTIICGMAGAAQGWVEAPYIDTPAKLDEIPLHAVLVPGTEGIVRILPGLAQRDMSAPDVLRGEETLLLGAVLAKSVSGTICLPGTHSKWVMIDKGEVSRFSTSMTGEVFSLLKTRSVLSHTVNQTPTVDSESEAFQSAVEEALNRPEKILQALFSVRSTPLLHASTTGKDMHARLSGLLLGLEIAGIGDVPRKCVTLVSAGQLAHNYKRALTVAGFHCELIDADEMVLAGLRYAAGKIWPESKT